MAEAVALPRRTVYRVPDGVALSIAALAEPVACSCPMGFYRLSPRQGESLLIIRASAGLINTALATHKGSRPVVVVYPTARDGRSLSNSVPT